MLSKTKKIALLTTGLVGALVTSSAVGVALSSCTTNNTSTEVEDNTKYNTYINWSDPNALTNLVVDESGLVYSDIYKTTIIAIVPSFTNTTITIPASVRAITGYTEVLPSGATIVRGAFQPSASVTVGTGTNNTQNGVTLNNLISTVKFAPNSQLKSIGAKAFYGCTLLESIDLPTTVTMIGDYAFNGCNLLKSINLTNVEYVGQYAFANLASTLISPKISISLNKAVVIGQNAFQNANIESVDFSANTSLISLGNNAFNGCSSLTGTIDLSKATSLTNTGNNTFENCSSITAVNLPSSLITIGQNAFNGCSSIANTIDLSGANRLTTIGDNAFSGCTKLTGLSYPTSAPITSFGANAFSGCSALTQLGSVANTFTAPAALTTIASNAFSGTAIATVDISSMTTATPFTTSSLAGMTSLTSVKFNNTITTLPANLFDGDVSLKTITLPSTITSVVANQTSPITSAAGYSTFYGSSLETVDMSAITSYSTNEGTTTTVPAYLFSGLTTLKNVVLKTGTTAIENNAFQGTNSLTSVKESSQTESSYTGYTTLGTLTRIGNNAFEGTGLTSFTLSAISNDENISKATTTFNLGNAVFQDATKLESVDLSNATGLTSIPINTFNNATALVSVSMPATPANSEIFTIKEGAFGGVSSLKSIDLSNYTNLSIETNNFNNATSLGEINLSNITGNIPNFISSTAITGVFTGLPSSAIVKLSSAINTITNSTVFTQATSGDSSTATRVALQYPNGITFTNSGENSQINSSGTLTNVASLLSNVSGSLDLSSNQTLTSMGTSTLFGNTGITSLTLSASNITANTNLYTLANDITPATITPSIARTESYTTTNVPLGNNSSLTSINFKNFSLTNNMVGPGALKTETFNSIAKIINSFAYYSNSENVENIVNFKEWTTSDNWIQTDATLTYAANNDGTNSGGTITIGNATLDSNGANTITLTNGTQSTHKITHNNIVWNLIYNPSTQTLTINSDDATPLNIYKGYSSQTSGSAKNIQVYVKADDQGSLVVNSGLKLTMTINLNPSNSSN